MKATADQWTAYYQVIVEIVRGCAFESFLELGIGEGYLAGYLKSHCPSLTQITGVDISSYHTHLPADYVTPEGVEYLHDTPTDQFFAEDERGWDCIFVDALHEHRQATRDFTNAMRVLNDDGLIFLHATYPPSPASLLPLVCGDVYKTYLELAERNDLEVVTLPLFNGLTIIRRVDERRLWTMEEN